MGTAESIIIGISAITVIVGVLLGIKNLITTRKKYYKEFNAKKDIETSATVFKPKKIKSFIYLDEYKLYSISSQVFEGLTEYIVHTQGQNQIDNTQQFGPIGSGRIVADIFREEKTTQEKKNLYDFAFNLLEDELIKSKKVLEINDSSIAEILEINETTFIKVTGKVIFNDMKILSSIVENFNKIGEALGYLTMQEEYKEQLNDMNSQLAGIKDRNQRAKAKQLVNKSKTLFDEYLKESGLTLEGEFIKQLKYILDFGYQGQFEIKMPFVNDDEKVLISTILNRGYLKEDEFELITKYSRKTEKDFTIFGILTQNERINQVIDEEEESTVEESDEAAGMKEAVLNLVDKLTNVETTFTGRLKYEYIIDPIAVYREI